MNITFLLVVFMVVVVPVVFGIGYAVFERLTEVRKKQIEATSQEAAEKAAQYAAKTERLEQRVAVLERTLTDRSARLAEQIDALKTTNVN